MGLHVSLEEDSITKHSGFYRGGGGGGGGAQGKVLGPWAHDQLSSILFGDTMVPNRLKPLLRFPVA